MQALGILKQLALYTNLHEPVGNQHSSREHHQSTAVWEHVWWRNHSTLHSNRFLNQLGAVLPHHVTDHRLTFVLSSSMFFRRKGKTASIQKLRTRSPFEIKNTRVKQETISAKLRVPSACSLLLPAKSLPIVSGISYASTLHSWRARSHLWHTTTTRPLPGLHLWYPTVEFPRDPSGAWLPGISSRPEPGWPRTPTHGTHPAPSCKLDFQLHGRMHCNSWNGGEMKYMHPLIAHARLLTMFNPHEARHTAYAFRASKEIECLQRHEVTMLVFRSLHMNGVIMNAVHTTAACEALCSSLLWAVRGRQIQLFPVGVRPLHCKFPTHSFCTCLRVIKRAFIWGDWLWTVAAQSWEGSMATPLQLRTVPGYETTKTMFDDKRRNWWAVLQRTTCNDEIISADPACSKGSASEEELPAARAKKSLQAARARSKKTRKKKQEARSNCRQQAARSKKQEARKQHAAGRQVRELVLLSIQKAPLGRRLEDRFWIQKATLGSGGRGPQARSVPQGPAVWLWRRRRFGSDS